MGPLLPLLQGFSPQELHLCYHPLEEELLCPLHTSDGPLLHDSNATSNLVQRTTMSNYDLGGEGDLLNAPKPMIGGPVIEFDPISAAILMMSNGDDAIATEAFKVADVYAVQNEQLLMEDFCECKNDLIDKSVIEDACSNLFDVECPALQMEEVKTLHNDEYAGDEPVQKSVGSDCLGSPHCINGEPMWPDFFDIQEMDLGDVCGIKRPYSEGEIQTVGNCHMSHFNGSNVHHSFEKLLTFGEERRQKLSRYRKKKTKRNFGRKIKYACRKALADSQPRVHGRFAKIEECEPARTM